VLVPLLLIEKKNLFFLGFLWSFSSPSSPPTSRPFFENHETHGTLFFSRHSFLFPPLLFFCLLVGGRFVEQKGGFPPPTKPLPFEVSFFFLLRASSRPQKFSLIPPPIQTPLTQFAFFWEFTGFQVLSLTGFFLWLPWFLSSPFFPVFFLKSPPGRPPLGLRFGRRPLVLRSGECMLFAFFFC